MKQHSILLALGCLITALYQPAAVAQEDYMDAELRERVEALKENFAERRSNQATGRDRARLLWDWMNAYARTGAHYSAERHGERKWNIGTVARGASVRGAAGGSGQLHH